LEDYEKALQTCHTIKLNHVDNLELDDAIALMEMQLTYLRIVEVVSGRDLALEVQKGVFKLYSRIFGPVGGKSGTGGFIKKEPVDLEQKAVIPEQPLRRARSTINPEKKGSLNALMPPEARESLESKLSLQVPKGHAGRPRSLLRKHRRSRSLDGQSLETRSSVELSENQSAFSTSPRLP